MATSPSTPSGTLTPKKKDESFLEKIGTLARKKKIKEVNELQEEGKHAIESPSSPALADIGPEGYQLGEAEERSMIEPHSRENVKLKDLIKILLEWINDELADHRIIVKDIEEDLFDGQILQKLIEKLANVKVEAPEVTQSEIGQKQKLRVVLDYINRMLQLPPVWNQQKWSVDSVHTKNLVAILHLLVALARHFRAPVRLPENVCVTLLVVQKIDGVLQTRRITEEITSTNDDIGARFERDAFDTLFDHAPDKLNVVKKTLVTFVNKQLVKVNLEVTDLDTQFHDGVYLVMLMGLLEGYFVPLYHFHLTPTSFEQKAQELQVRLKRLCRDNAATVKSHSIVHSLLEITSQTPNTDPMTPGPSTGISCWKITQDDNESSRVDPVNKYRQYSFLPSAIRDWNELPEAAVAADTLDSFKSRVHNVTFAFELMEDAGLQKPKARPEDVVNLDLKSTLRVLYNIFTKYKASTSTSSAVH